VTAITNRITSRQSRPTLVAALVVAIFVGFVVQESWAGYEITGDSILRFVVVGVTLGSIYAVAASGLVVTYTTSGIFNFAQGAIGMLMAFVYWELKVNAGVQTFVALVITVGIAAPLLGMAIERVLMRRLTDAPLVAQLVVTIGLMLALMGFTLWLWDPNETRSIGTFFPDTVILGDIPGGIQIGETFLPYYRLITILTGIAIAIGLRFVLYRTRLGIGMRAVVDNRDLAALNGARPGRISSFSWALGSSMAALAGIFLAEELSSLSVDTLTLLIVDAFAAAIIGRLRSLPLTYVGGMIIGLSLAFQSNFLLWSGRWANAANAIPTIILFLALLFLPQARIEGRRSLRVVTPRVPTMRRAAFGMGVLLLVVFLISLILNRTEIRDVTLALGTALIMLSLVPLTGWSGQISLAQITFVGAGAFAIAEWGTEFGTLGGMLIAAAFAVPFGLLIALPALRLQGLYLALASMAFAVMAKFVFFDQPEVLGNGAKRVTPFEILGWNTAEPFSILGHEFPADTGLLFMTVAVFAIVGLGVTFMRRGSFGRRLIAMRDSPAACATLGVNLLRTKLIVFVLSAAMAGFAGALYGALLGSVTTQNFEMLVGLPYLLLLVVGGVSVVSGALMGGVSLVVFYKWIPKLNITIEVFNRNLVTLLSRIGPGLAGIGIGRQPAGVIPTVGHEQREKRAAKARAAAGDDHAGDGPESPAVTPPTSAPVSTPGA
jgi:branched-chain amino acid transport system permease protein